MTGTLWVVDRHTASVYEYIGASSVLTGAIPASHVHPLDPANQNPEGIADPTIPINIGDTVVDSIATVTEVDLFPFTATAGQTIYLDFQAVSNTVDWKIKNPSGTVIASVGEFCPERVGQRSRSVADCGRVHDPSCWPVWFHAVVSIQTLECPTTASQHDQPQRYRERSDRNARRRGRVELYGTSRSTDLCRLPAV